MIKKKWNRFHLVKDNYGETVGSFVLSEDGILHDVYIHCDQRGKGFGNRLMATVINLARKLTPKIKKISLLVDRDNEIAIRLYRKFGFGLVQDGAGGMIEMEKIINY